nr:family 78 glycoside hydrolase catalytic domain [uncultured Acetatifactor sp.]
MEKAFENALWIWCNANPRADEYGEFLDRFDYEAGNVTLRISADSNYAAYVNGVLAAWGQYADFPYDKVYDEVDITACCTKGANCIAIVVWYYGIASSSTYCLGNAGLLYEVVGEEKMLCRSSEDTLSRMSRAYRNHRMHIITGQLGLGYGYDAAKEDDWMTGASSDFHPAVVVKQELPLRIRPCDKLTLLSDVDGTECKRISDTDVIFDLGSEQVGFLRLKLNSPREQDITIAYGEHIEDGCVRRIIGGRDFSVSYRAKQGENEYLNPFRRLGCRYLEIHSEHPVTVEKLAIAPAMYVLAEKARPRLNALQTKIYDMCVETLHLCMHEHYEDCPWREQALYAMDSRNQMLAGYYAFGEYRFPRACLQLMSKDRREDGLMSICYPIKMDFVIPSFSLHYITECREYLDYSGDLAFLEEIYPKLVSVAEAFTSHIKDGLIPPFAGKRYWNFYEWRQGLDGAATDTSRPDVILNALLSLALQNLGAIADRLGRKNDYSAQAQTLNGHIRQAFWDEEAGLCRNLSRVGGGSQLGNALAILCGAVTGSEAESLCRRLRTDEALTPISLSMLCFKYDAWLKVDKERYAPVILEDIERIYTPMVEYGGTTVWETELGEKDFDNAGSLCHGWSAMPIYYYHILENRL